MVITTRKALCTPFQECDCHMPNHSPPTPTKPPSKSRNPSVSPSTAMLLACWYSCALARNPCHRHGDERAERRQDDLRGDDQDIAGVVEGGRCYRAPVDVRRGGDIVYVEHMSDKGEVRPIVRNIAKSDERRVERDGVFRARQGCDGISW